jgi:mannan endo-1,4-beta-mannosidase
LNYTFIYFFIQGKLLSGQFAGYSPKTFSTSIINQTTQLTGKTPGILGCDWACGWDSLIPPQNLINYSCNAALKNQWNLGGLVTISMHLPNPVSPNGGYYNNPDGLNFADLINNATATGQRWLLFLNRMAQGLYDLQQSGVTVLFRPFHEMNGNWFFWGDQVKKRDLLK